MTVRIDDSLDGIDWEAARADLIADDFDNGRSPAALKRSFEQSPHVAIARDGDRVVGMARLLSDGVCNAYLVDVWTASSHRRQGIAAQMLRLLIAAVPGQHIGLQTDRRPGALRVGRLPATTRVLGARLRHVARQRREPALKPRAERAKLTA